VKHFGCILLLSFTLMTNVSMAKTKAKTKTTPMVKRDFAFNPNLNFSKNLQVLKNLRSNPRLFVHLSNGNELSGKLGAIGSSSFVIQELSGKDFYDALVSNQSVVSIEVQMRNLPKEAAPAATKK